MKTRRLSASDLRVMLGAGDWFPVFEADESALPQRVIFVDANRSEYIVIAAREDGCLDVVLEEA